MALNFLEENPLFASSKLEGFQQPLLPGTNVNREYCVVVSISLASTLKKQRDVFVDNEDTKKARKELIESNIYKDVLLFKDDVIKGTSYSTKRNNRCAQIKITKEECEEYFQFLESMGFGSI